MNIVQQSWGAMMAVLVAKFMLNDMPHAIGLMSAKAYSIPSYQPSNKVAIVGGGVAGSYLYRMLKEYKPSVQADVYSIPMSTRCGIRSCGWIVSYPEFKRLGSSLSIDFEQFISGRFNRIDVDGKLISADIAVINKPLMIEKLLDGCMQMHSNPDLSAYDRVVDATGKRIYLPSGPSPSVVAIYQVRILDTNYSYQHPITSVKWDKEDKELLYVIPIGDGTVHVGYGSPIAPEKSMGKIRQFIGNAKVICGCASTLWFGGPILPAVHGKFFGVGESIGLVDPLSGMGITPAMDSARALVEYWDKPREYERYIEQKYSFMSRLKKVRDGEVPPLRLLNIALSFKDEYALLGFRPGIRMAYSKLSA